MNRRSLTFETLHVILFACKLGSVTFCFELSVCLQYRMKRLRVLYIVGLSAYLLRNCRSDLKNKCIFEHLYEVSFFLCTYYSASKAAMTIKSVCKSCLVQFIFGKLLVATFIWLSSKKTTVCGSVAK